jgi:hypothetical protein
MRLDATLLVFLVLAYISSPRGFDAERLEFPAGGFSIVLPDGWDGPIDAHEETLPAASAYRMRHAGDGPFAGAEVRVIRRANLNPLQAQQWMRGRAAVGLGDLRPVEALRGDAMPFRSGAGYRAEGGGQSALVYFTAHGGTHYALVASISSDRFVAATGALLGIAQSVQFVDPAP